MYGRFFRTLSFLRPRHPYREHASLPRSAHLLLFGQNYPPYPAADCRVPDSTSLPGGGDASPPSTTILEEDFFLAFSALKYLFRSVGFVGNSNVDAMSPQDLKSHEPRSEKWKRRIPNTFGGMLHSKPSRRCKGGIHALWDRGKTSLAREMDHGCKLFNVHKAKKLKGHLANEALQKFLPK